MKLGVQSFIMFFFSLSILFAQENQKVILDCDLDDDIDDAFACFNFCC